MNIRINYRIDNRIRVVEVSSGTKKFLVSLGDFMEETGEYHFGESTGIMDIDGKTFLTLWEESIR